MRRLIQSKRWQRTKVALSVIVWIIIGLSVVSLS